MRSVVVESPVAVNGNAEILGATDRGGLEGAVGDLAPWRAAGRQDLSVPLPSDILRSTRILKRGISCTGGISEGMRWTLWWRRDEVSRWPLSASGDRNASNPLVFPHSDVNIPKEKTLSSPRMSQDRTPVASVI